jgi:hypothetical protein
VLNHPQAQFHPVRDFFRVDCALVLAELDRPVPPVSSEIELAVMAIVVRADTVDSSQLFDRRCLFHGRRALERPAHDVVLCPTRLRYELVDDRLELGVGFYQLLEEADPCELAIAHANVDVRAAISVDATAERDQLIGDEIKPSQTFIAAHNTVAARR